MVLRLERYAWSMVKLLRKATHKYAPPPPRLAQSPSMLTLKVIRREMYRGNVSPLPARHAVPRRQVRVIRLPAALFEPPGPLRHRVEHTQRLPLCVEHPEEVVMSKMEAESKNHVANTVDKNPNDSLVTKCFVLIACTWDYPHTLLRHLSLYVEH